MTKVAFILTMPGVASWNGKWSGEDKLYAQVRTFKAKEAVKAEEILQKGYYSYGWSDGWRAAVQARRVDAAEAKKLLKKSSGFCGYEWMIDSIIKHGAIYASAEEVLIKV